MIKLIKFTLPLFVLLYSNIEVAHSRFVYDYSNNSYQYNNIVKSSVEFINPNLNNNNVSFPTSEELDEFWKYVNDNKTGKVIALQLAESSFKHQFNNIKNVNYKYIAEFPNINTWSFFNAMQNATQKAINTFGGENKEQLKIPQLFKNYSNTTLDKIAELYLSKYSPSNNNYYSEYNDIKFNINLISDVQEILDALKFDKIFETIVKGTLKAKELLQPVKKDQKLLQLNNKDLNDNYEKELDSDSGYFLKFENHDIGICWLDATFEIIYNSVINSNDKEIKNTNIYKFVKFLEQKQKDKRKEVKAKNGQQIVFKKKERTPDGNIIMRIRSIVLTDQISLLEAFDEFESKMKKEDLEVWNNSDKVKKAKEKIHELIKAHKKAKSLRNKNNNNQDNNYGGTSQQGMDLFINLFPELKKIFVPQYSNIEKTITFNNIYDNIIPSIDGYKSSNVEISSKVKYNIITSRNYSEQIPISKHDTLTTSDNKHKITSLPEYMIFNGANIIIKDSVTIAQKQPIKFNEEINKYMAGITSNGELALYQISSMGMNTSDTTHAYSLYNGSNGWYMLDDHNKYYKLKPDEFKATIDKDKVETFVYKKISCEKIDNKKEEMINKDKEQSKLPN